MQHVDVVACTAGGARVCVCVYAREGSGWRPPPQPSPPLSAAALRRHAPTATNSTHGRHGFDPVPTHPAWPSCAAPTQKSPAVPPGCQRPPPPAPARTPCRPPGVTTGAGVGAGLGREHREPCAVPAAKCSPRRALHLRPAPACGSIVDGGSSTAGTRLFSDAHLRAAGREGAATALLHLPLRLTSTPHASPPLPSPCRYHAAPCPPRPAAHLATLP